MTPILHRLTENVTAIDLQFQGRPEVIAAYLFYDGETAALIETGPAITLDNLLEAVQAAGAPLEALRQVIVTHIHLDHSGAAGIIAKRLPWATVYVHPIGAPHLLDPSKLLASATRLYGDNLDSLWGIPAPVPENNLVVFNDGESLAIPGSTLRAYDTPGHARHHHAYLDEQSGLLFTGDVGGVRMPGIRYVRPPTPPPELEIDAWVASVARLRALNASGLCLTHLGLFRGNLDWHWNDLEHRLVKWGDLIRDALVEGVDESEMLRRIKNQVALEMQTLGADLAAYDVAASYEAIVSGYVRYWKKKISSTVSK